MPKGDLVLITFPFSDLSDSKLRPAVILFETGQDVTVSFITSQIGWKEFSDLLVNPNFSNGLKKPSLVRTGKICTLDKRLLKGELGKLTSNEIDEIDNKLKKLFNLV